MWRRTYLLLALVRIYFALSPSYLHPDETFQGPEVIAGHLFPYPSHQTWEWTASKPIRSVFPLWPLFGFPMTLLKWLWADENNLVSPQTIYYALRVVMFILSFVLEDWAIHEMVASPRHRRRAIVLVASSYVTWTFQTHTFSNSLETILVLWSLVLIERVTAQKDKSSFLSYVILSLLCVLGTFNRITFPAYILIPGLKILPQLLQKPLSLACMVLFIALFTLLAIATDTSFHYPEATSSVTSLISVMQTKPVITPLNSLLYNIQSSNLALHGLHPRYQHVVVNLPQLLGPALLLLFSPSMSFQSGAFLNTQFISALSGTLILSTLPHQEPRFLLPVVPLLLTCIPPLPQYQKANRAFWAVWIIFNSFMGILMGTYHQGGIVPSQLAIPNIINAINTNTTLPLSDISTSPIYPSSNPIDVATILWWKTYPPPTYLLGTGANVLDPITNTSTSIPITTTALMGLPKPDLETLLLSSLPACTKSKIPKSQNPSPGIFLVFPSSSLPILFPNTPCSSASNLSPQTLTITQQPDPKSKPESLLFTPLHLHRQHINLDDLDIPEEGIIETLRRVIGGRGLGVWKVERVC